MTSAGEEDHFRLTSLFYLDYLPTTTNYNYTLSLNIHSLFLSLSLTLSCLSPNPRVGVLVNPIHYHASIQQPTNNQQNPNRSNLNPKPKSPRYAAPLSALSAHYSQGRRGEEKAELMNKAMLRLQTRKVRPRRLHALLAL